VLRVVISPEGRVVEVSVHRSSGFPALDEAALAAVRKWRWSPTLRDGRAVSITGLVQLPFILHDS
jgi:protein TonB